MKLTHSGGDNKKPVTSYSIIIFFFFDLLRPGSRNRTPKLKELKETISTSYNLKTFSSIGKIHSMILLTIENIACLHLYSISYIFSSTGKRMPSLRTAVIFTVAFPFRYSSLTCSAKIFDDFGAINSVAVFCSNSSLLYPSILHIPGFASRNLPTCSLITIPSLMF